MAVYPGCYTGIHGVCTKDGSDEETTVKCDISITRTEVSQKVSGKYAPKKVPGGFDIKIAVTEILKDGLMLGRIINETPITGTAVTLEAAKVFTAGTVFEINDAPPTTPSQVKLTLTVAPITTGGYVVLVGTDANDVEISEVIEIANGSVAGTTWTSEKVYKTCPYMLPVTVASTGGGKFTVDAIVGAAAYTVGDPDIFDFVAKWDKGTPEIVFTCNNCFLTSAKTGFEDSDKMSLADYEIVMQDADTDFSMDYVAET
jgi:hypothetical protein